MLNAVRPALVIVVALTLITGLAYPLAITGLAGLLFPHQAQGSIIEKDGKPIGSALIGQAFTSDRYFHGRPSATTTADPNDPTKTVPAPYNAANSGGSNLGPTNKALLERVQGDLDALKKDNPSAAVPIDLVTTSGSGLDPAHLAGGRVVPGAPRRQGARPVGGCAAPAREPACGGPAARVLRRAARQRARAEPGPGRHGALT